ncbi:MAG: hypothetical protein U0736_07260 [Gemmataceae bacterium]
MTTVAVFVLTMLTAAPAEAATTAAPPAAAPAKRKPAAPPDLAQTEATLATQFRAFVLEALPDPLYEDAKKWGMQRKNARGKLKNDGRWLKLRIVGRDLRNSLRLDVKNMQKSPGRTAFNVVVQMPAVIELERQTWKLGVRVYSGSTRARVRVALTLACEVQTRLDKADNWVPDLIVRFRITGSDFQYSDLVVEHTAGVGGDAAKVLGDMLIGLVKTAKPNLQRDLAAKVNAAVLKAGQAKEVRISLTDWISGKAVVPTGKPAKAAAPAGSE